MALLLLIAIWGTYATMKTRKADSTAAPAAAAARRGNLKNSTEVGQPQSCCSQPIVVLQPGVGQVRKHCACKVPCAGSRLHSSLTAYGVWHAGRGCMQGTTSSRRQYGGFRVLAGGSYYRC